MGICLTTLPNLVNVSHYSIRCCCWFQRQSQKNLCHHSVSTAVSLPILSPVTEEHVSLFCLPSVLFSPESRLTIPPHLGTDLAWVPLLVPAPVPEEPVSPFRLTWVPISPGYCCWLQRQSQKGLSPPFRLTWVPISPGYCCWLQCQSQKGLSPPFRLTLVPISPGYC